MNNKTDIEKDVKLLEEISKCFTYSMWSEDTEALRRVLADRERLEKRNNNYEKGIDRLKKQIAKKEQQNNEEISKIVIERIGRKTVQKANKYDSLVEKIEDRFKARRIELLKNDKETENDIVLDILQELLDTEKEEV